MKSVGQRDMHLRDHRRRDVGERAAVLADLTQIDMRGDAIAAKCEAKPLASSAPTIVLPNAPPMERRNSRQPVAAPISRRSADMKRVIAILGVSPLIEAIRA
jgi:hypothetical protein